MHICKTTVAASQILSKCSAVLDVNQARVVTPEKLPAPTHLSNIQQPDTSHYTAMDTNSQKPLNLCCSYMYLRLRAKVNLSMIITRSTSAVAPRSGSSGKVWQQRRTLAVIRYQSAPTAEPRNSVKQKQLLASLTRLGQLELHSCCCVQYN